MQTTRTFLSILMIAAPGIWSISVTAADATPMARAKDGGTAVTAPRPSDAVLLNPRMGLYMQYPPLDLPHDHWMMGIADIAYYRLDWVDINPEEGVYRFDA